MEAIKNAKELKNVSQLKFFFGLLNYCHKHFQSLCSTGTFSLFIKKKYEMVLRIDCFWGSPKYSRWNKIISSLWRYKTFNISFPCFTTPAGCSCFIKCKIVKKKQQHLPLVLFQRLKGAIRKVRQKLYPANIYLFKVKNINSGKKCGICPKLTRKTPQDDILVFLLLAPNIIYVFF